MSKKDSHFCAEFSCEHTLGDFSASLIPKKKKKITKTKTNKEICVQSVSKSKINKSRNNKKAGTSHLSNIIRLKRMITKWYRFSFSRCLWCGKISILQIKTELNFVCSHKFNFIKRREGNYQIKNTTQSIDGWIVCSPAALVNVWVNAFQTFQNLKSILQ